MLKISRILFIVLLGMPLCSAASISAQADIGINLPAYPELVVVPGYPVYYAPREESNYFFYDGMYWVYQNDSWYTSSWYNGPWGFVEPASVPLYVLRVPVRYYRMPPMYFRGWRSEAPPRWGEYWGPGWAQRRNGWDRWDRRAVPMPAPLPLYQRHYSAGQYPLQIERQREIQKQNYRYRPLDGDVRRLYQKHDAPGAAVRQEKTHQEKNRPQEQNDRQDRGHIRDN